jgi:hypothetical protein
LAPCQATPPIVNVGVVHASVAHTVQAGLLGQRGMAFRLNLSTCRSKPESVGASSSSGRPVIALASRIFLAVYVAAMIAAVVLLDVTIFHKHLWARLMVNIGIIMVFVAFYLRFFKTP